MFGGGPVLLTTRLAAEKCFAEVAGLDNSLEALATARRMFAF
ncbi:MAG: hypothetical protein SCI25_10660 [Desulfuromonadales bacterium]|nr:hypothetical protein [Desulfuromonadales bacterium]